MTATASPKAAASNGAGATVKEPPPPPQIAAVRGEVVEDQPTTKALVWHGVDLVLPAELGAAFMMDVFEAQLGDETALLRGIYQAVGKEQWAKARKVAAEDNLPAQDFNSLVTEILAMYGMAPGEQSDSANSSQNDSG
jgi:hypothetical protein